MAGAEHLPGIAKNIVENIVASMGPAEVIPEDVAEEAVQRAVTEHKVVPLVYYAGIQRRVIGEARITQDGVHAEIDPESKSDVAQWLHDNLLVGVTMSFSIPPTVNYGLEDLGRGQFEYPTGRREEILKKFAPPEPTEFGSKRSDYPAGKVWLEEQREEAFKKYGPPLLSPDQNTEDINYEIRKDMGLDD